MFSITIKHKSSCDNFFLRYCKNFTNFLSRGIWTRNLEIKMPTCRNFDVYLHAKILKTCYFDYDENA